LKLSLHLVGIYRYEQFFLAFEVKINRPLALAQSFCNYIYGNLAVALLGESLGRPLDNPFPLVLFVFQ
jgi:hypothetical protein